MAEVEKEQFFALGLSKFKDELPQIGRVLMIEEDEITVEWWVGTYSDTWNPWTVKLVEQTAFVHRNCIVLGNTTFIGCQTYCRKIKEYFEFM